MPEYFENMGLAQELNRLGLQNAKYITSGSVFYVDSGHANALDSADGFHGKSWSNPFATLNFAISTASAGDFIFLAPGHAETIEDKGTASGATTGEVTVDKIGISIIGLGNSDLRPTFSLATATDACINVTVGNVLIENIKLVSALADVISGIILGAAADGAIIRKCRFEDGSSDLEILVGISVTAACGNLIIEDNEFFGTVGAEATEAIELVGASDNTIIRNNILYGDWKGAGGAISCSGAASVGLIVKHNIVCNQDASVGLAMDFHASSKGFCVGNQCGGLLNNTLPITGGEAMMFSDNRSTDAVAVSAIQTPEAIAASS